MGCKLNLNREAPLNLLLPADDEKDRQRAGACPESLRGLAGLPDEADFDWIRKKRRIRAHPCLFTHDSGLEEALI